MVEFVLERTDPIFSGHVFGVERRHLLAGTEPFDREVVTHPGAVAVLALDAAGCAVLLSQYRAPVGDRIYEIPAGTLDVQGESPVEAAQRELIEETGFQAGTLELLGKFFNSPGYSSQVTSVYVASDLHEVGANPVGVEEADMQVIAVPLSRALDMVETGEIRCAITALALALCARRG